ncbi:IS5 family transposase [candidate division KSB1 bacterium]|nr:IS5 family transposase [candidate division KSB1 bacterium]
MDLAEEQWALIAPLVVDKPRIKHRNIDGGGRPRVPARDVWNGILWVLRTGAPWHDLPDRYPPYQTCHRRFQEYCRNGTFEKVLRSLAEDLRERGGLDLSETFIDGTFAPAKKGGRQGGPTRRGNGTKIMALADRAGFLIALCTASASPNEVTLVEQTIDARFIGDVPERIIGDKAYDSDSLDEQLRRDYGIEMIAPNKSNRSVKTQDGRALRRYKRRWKIERCFAWLTRFRRFPVKYEYHIENFLGFLHLACLKILLRCF